MRSSSQPSDQESPSLKLSQYCPSPAEPARLPGVRKRWKGLQMSWEWVVWARWDKLLSHLGKFFRAVQKAGVTVVWGYRACRMCVYKKLGFIALCVHRPTSVFKPLGPNSSRHYGGWLTLCYLMTIVEIVGLLHRLQAFCGALLGYGHKLLQQRAAMCPTDKRHQFYMCKQA